MKYNYEKDSKKDRKRYVRIKNAVFSLLGTNCIKCGISDIRVLQIDHINGGGSKHRKNFQGRGMYYLILANPQESMKNYQILCANCNWIKRAENNENRGRLRKSI